MLCAAIAPGLLQLIALRFAPQVWQDHSLYQVLAALLVKQLVNLPPNRIISKIRRCLAPADEDGHEDHRSVA